MNHYGVNMPSEVDTQNPVYQSIGRYPPCDGDGMLGSS